MPAAPNASEFALMVVNTYNTQGIGTLLQTMTLQLAEQKRINEKQQETNEGLSRALAELGQKIEDQKLINQMKAALKATASAAEAVAKAGLKGMDAIAGFIVAKATETAKAVRDFEYKKNAEAAIKSIANFFKKVGTFIIEKGGAALRSVGKAAIDFGKETARVAPLVAKTAVAKGSQLKHTIKADLKEAALGLAVKLAKFASDAPEQRTAAKREADKATKAVKNIRGLE